MKVEEGTFCRIEVKRKYEFKNEYYYELYYGRVERITAYSVLLDTYYRQVFSTPYSEYEMTKMLQRSMVNISFKDIDEILPLEESQVVDYVAEKTKDRDELVAYNRKRSIELDKIREGNKKIFVESILQQQEANKSRHRLRRRALRCPFCKENINFNVTHWCKPDGHTTELIFKEIKDA
jgi:hypothetical protein